MTSVASQRSCRSRSSSTWTPRWSASRRIGPPQMEGRHSWQEDHRLGIPGRACRSRSSDPGEFGVVVAAVVADLLDQDRFPLVSRQAQGRHQGVAGETGVDPVDVQRRATRLACLPSGSRNHSSACSGATSHTIEVPTTLVPAPGTDDLVDGVLGAGLGLRRVHDAVGVEGDQRLSIVSGDDPARGREAAHSAASRRSSGLVGVDADEFQVWAFDQCAQLTTDVAGGELDYSSHACPLKADR